MKYAGILVGALLSSALLAACSGNRTFSSPTSLMPAAPERQLESALLKQPEKSSPEKILYHFKGGMDGDGPASVLINVNGVFYGTTGFGGGPTCASFGTPLGCGTIFRIDPSGANYKVLHRFPTNALGGALPFAGVVALGDKLYGTTDWGGGNGQKKFVGCANNVGCGTVFEVDPGRDVDFNILRRFGAIDGLAAIGGLVASDDTLYGTTLGGGTGTCNGLKYACGLIFSLSPSNEAPLHEFGHGFDGSLPYYAPIVVGRTLYGATAYGGGATACVTPYAGCGTIYKIDANGKGYRVLHRFKGGAEGANPNNVIYVDGTLYGTGTGGGDTSCSVPSVSGCGVIFRLNTDGSHYRVLHRFQGGTDGAGPNSVLAEANHTLYSTATFGGGTNCNNFGGTGCGVVFKIKTSGNEYGVVYRFQGGTDGANPSGSGPIYLGGELYGPTEAGGGSGCGGNGCGTIYEVTP